MEPQQVTIELGRTRLAASACRKLSIGTLVALDQSVEEPVSVYADQRLVARGEIVVVDNKFGVRVTELISRVNTIA